MHCTACVYDQRWWCWETSWKCWIVRRGGRGCSTNCHWNWTECHPNSQVAINVCHVLQVQMINDLTTVVVLLRDRLKETDHEKGLVVDRCDLRKLNKRVYEIKHDIKREAQVKRRKKASLILHYIRIFHTDAHTQHTHIQQTCTHTHTHIHTHNKHACAHTHTHTQQTYKHAHTHTQQTHTWSIHAHSLLCTIKTNCRGICVRDILLYVALEIFKCIYLEFSFFFK
jgi:hypothetical protein